jgi:hypothetical protein
MKLNFMSLKILFFLPLCWMEVGFQKYIEKLIKENQKRVQKRHIYQKHLRFNQ